MWIQALAAYVHFVAIFATVALLLAELATYRTPIAAESARRLGRMDIAYGIASLLAVGTGFARAFWFAKGWDFYRHNPVFWLKVALVVVWALLSLPPTFHFAKLARSARGVAGPIALDVFEVERMRKFLWAQIAIIPFIPFLAVLIARGIGA